MLALPSDCLETTVVLLLACALQASSGAKKRRRGSVGSAGQAPADSSSPPADLDTALAVVGRLAARAGSADDADDARFPSPPVRGRKRPSAGDARPSAGAAPASAVARSSGGAAGGSGSSTKRARLERGTVTPAAAAAAGWGDGPAAAAGRNGGGAAAGSAAEHSAEYPPWTAGKPPDSLACCIALQNAMMSVCNAT